MPQKFGEWLTGQEGREDLIGDLARITHLQNAAQAVSGRKRDEHKIWADIVIGMVEPGHVAVFNEAWQEFLVAQQPADDPTEQSR